ncbi:IclR family transcriptional regulator [Rhodococcus sp. KBS0724]|uniref:IclR family transcriptional regulator n=1 Tax=Rhodococcus sp. KBS0724 TaxID=1179674 RepID=UPI00110DA69C|nr:IclR family transcriptional regulator [Rhodococcus sp. KBS0724]TSD40375.1 IclR family transcriptional regulator [Rhodococcus sp. KBS0724]
MNVGLAAEQPNSSVDRTLAVFDAFTSSNTPAALRISQISERSGMPKSTVHRLLAAMVAHGYVRKAGVHYRLAERIFELGHHAQVGQIGDLRDVANPYIAELFAATRHTIHLAVLSGTDVLYVEKMHGLGSLDIPTRTGGRQPAYSTGVGKALLAFGSPDAVSNALRLKFHRFTAYTVASARGMEQSICRIRDSGIAIDREESFLGVTCIAAPVMDIDLKTAVAAISITGPATGTTLLRHRSLLSKTADQLSHALHGVHINRMD